MINKCRVVITGIGAVSPSGAGVERLFMAHGRSPDITMKPGGKTVKSMGPVHGAGGVRRSGRTRRLDKASLAALLAVEEAIHRSGFRVRDRAEETGIILGSRSAGFDVSIMFLEQLRDLGPEAASPMLFPNTVLNAPVGHLAIHTGIRGPGWMVSGKGECGVSALLAAAEQIEHAFLIGAVTGGVEIWHPMLNAPTLEKTIRERSFVPGEGAYILFLEDETHAKARRAPFMGHIMAWTEREEEPREIDIREHVTETMRCARTFPEQIDVVVTASPAPDITSELELPVLRTLFPGAGTDWIQPASILGYSGVSGTGGIVMALAALERRLSGQKKRKTAGAFIRISDGHRRFHGCVISLSQRQPS